MHSVTIKLVDYKPIGYDDEIDLRFYIWHSLIQIFRSSSLDLIGGALVSEGWLHLFGKWGDFLIWVKCIYSPTLYGFLGPTFDWFSYFWSILCYANSTYSWIKSKKNHNLNIIEL